MSFTRSNLKRLEAAARGGPCPECKLSSYGPGYVVYEEGEECLKDADERCASCGRHLWTVIKVAYEDEGGGGGT